MTQLKTTKKIKRNKTTSNLREKKMYVKLNDRVYLNKDKITRVKVDSVQDGIRIRFYEGQNQVAKSGRFETEAKAIDWLEKNFINK